MGNSTALVERAATGDPAAFSQLLIQHRGLVYAVCLSQVRNVVEADDLTQEVFVRAYQDLPRLRQPEKFIPWLRQVARNVCRMRLRRPRAATVSWDNVSEQDDPVALARLRRMELGEIVSRMLAQVTPKSREVLTLRYLADCSEAEIAEALSLSPTTVKSRLHAGREQAKRELLPVVKELLSLQTPSREMVEQIMARCGNPGCICPEILTEGR